MCGATGAIAASAALLLPSRESFPTVVQVVRVAAVSPRGPAPPVYPRNSRRLAAHVDDVWFPTWRAFGWRAVGRSRQTIEGRRAATVYYAHEGGAHIAYTIVAAGALRWPAGARVVTRGWRRFRIYSDAGRRVIGWREQGHECLIAGPRSLSEDALLGLAVWDA